MRNLTLVFGSGQAADLIAYAYVIRHQPHEEDFSKEILEHKIKMQFGEKASHSVIGMSMVDNQIDASLFKS